jgi:hypothetical protein
MRQPNLSKGETKMKTPKRIAAVVAPAALAVGVGAGLADAARTGGGGGTAAAAGKPTRGPGGPASQAILAYLGVTAAELRTQLEAGKTLADVAKAQGKTVAGLEDAIVADAKTKLDAAVADGRLTQAQATAMLADLKTRVSDMVANVGPGPGGHGHGGHGHGGHGHGPFDPAAIAAYLGLTQAELRTQLEAGKTLAQVATAQGKTVAGLEDAIVASATKKLDAAVAAGRLTAAQKTAALARLNESLDDMVDRTGPPRGGKGGKAGPPPAAPGGTTTTTLRVF